MPIAHSSTAPRRAPSICTREVPNKKGRAKSRALAKKLIAAGKG